MGTCETGILREMQGTPTASSRGASISKDGKEYYNPQLDCPREAGTSTTALGYRKLQYIFRSGQPTLRLRGRLLNDQRAIFLSRGRWLPDSAVQANLDTTREDTQSGETLLHSAYREDR